MKKIIKLSIIFLLLFNVYSFCVLTVSAAADTGLLPAEGNKPTGCPADTNCGGYTLNDMVSVAVKVSQLILSIVGSLALLAFVAGGLMWMLSAGNTEWVTRGKQTIIGAVIGLAIVFTSYMIIQLVFTSLGIDAAKRGEWSNISAPWNNFWR